MPTDYYAVLGVSEDAEADAIKKRYRLLVRENHPDALPPAEREAAHLRMQAINAAWKVLSDPAARASYDLSLREAELRAQLRAAQAAAASQNAARTAKKTATPKNAAPASHRPSGRTNRRPASTQKTSGSRAANGRAANGHAANGRNGHRNGAHIPANPRAQLLAMVRKAEELFIFQGQIADAIAMCEKVLSLDPTCAEAAALLGDIYLEHGAPSQAAAYYRQAIRIQPGNEEYRRKLAGALGENAPPSPNVSTQKTRHAKPRKQPSRDEPIFMTRSPSETLDEKNARLFKSERRYAVDKESRQSGALALGALAIVLLAVSALGGESAPAATSTLAVLSPFTPRSLALCSAAAALVGAALPLYGIVEPLGEQSPSQPAMLGIPLVAVSLVAGSVLGPLAFAALFVFSLIWRSFASSLFTILLAATAICLAMALTVPDEHIKTALSKALLEWGGRTIFPMTVVGWWLGSRQVVSR